MHKKYVLYTCRLNCTGFTRTVYGHMHLASCMHACSPKNFHKDLSTYLGFPTLPREQTPKC